MDAITKYRKSRLKALIDGKPYNGNQAHFAREAKVTKARITQLLDENEAFGERSAENIRSNLELPERFFEDGFSTSLADASTERNKAPQAGASWDDLNSMRSMASIPSVSEDILAYPFGNFSDRRKQIDLINNPAYPAIRRVNIKLSAGASGFGVDYVDDDEAPIVFQRKWFEHHGYIPDKLLAVRVSNGSMEPGLYDGDTVIINTADIALKDGVVFSMNYEGELVVKRLVRDAGEWWLASDNPDQRRYPRKVCTEDVFCIGRIVHRQSERI